MRSKARYGWLLAVTLGLLQSGASAAEPCLAPAAWYVVTAAAPRASTAQQVLGASARHDVVLLGEQHDNADHHRWQLQTLAALHVLRPEMVIGFESFPRRLQTVLDDWVAGKLTPQQLLERTEWRKVWNLEPELYLPLFEFARVNRIPMAALNVERELTSSVRNMGWDATPVERREGVSRAAPAPAPYEDFLFEVFRRHTPAGKSPPARDSAAFRYFVEAQITWDRAMAEALAARLTGFAPRPLVVGIMGAGHVRHGHGVPHQLRDLGVVSVASLLPLDRDSSCGELGRIADAVFVLPPVITDAAPLSPPTSRHPAPPAPPAPPASAAPPPR